VGGFGIGIAVLVLVAAAALAYLWIAWGDVGGGGGGRVGGGLDACGGLVYVLCGGEGAQRNGERGRVMLADIHGAFGPSEAGGGGLADVIRS